MKCPGSSNDRDPILVTVGSTTPNNVLSNAYSTRDVNLNGEVKYTGSGNDRDPILVNVGSTTPNNIRVHNCLERNDRSGLTGKGRCGACAAPSPGVSDLIRASGV